MYVSWLRVGDIWVVIEADVPCFVVTSAVVPSVFVAFCVVAVAVISS